MKFLNKTLIATCIVFFAVNAYAEKVNSDIQQSMNNLIEQKISQKQEQLSLEKTKEQQEIKEKTEATQCKKFFSSSEYIPTYKKQAYAYVIANFTKSAFGTYLDTKAISENIHKAYCLTLALSKAADQLNTLMRERIAQTKTNDPYKLTRIEILSIEQINKSSLDFEVLFNKYQSDVRELAFNEPEARKQTEFKMKISLVQKTIITNHAKNAQYSGKIDINNYEYNPFDLWVSDYQVTQIKPVAK